MSQNNPNLAALWEEHIRHEFSTKDTQQTLDTMIDDAYVNHIPTMTGGNGKTNLEHFYSNHFIPKMPDDVELIPISRTVGETRVVDEFVFKFTHKIQMDWMLPGLKPTNKKVEIPFVVIVQFEGEKLAHEHIYWDQASVLVQLGLLGDTKGLPVTGQEQSQKATNPSSQVSNQLINKR